MSMSDAPNIKGEVLSPVLGPTNAKPFTSSGSVHVVLHRLLNSVLFSRWTID